ncbi:helix-turn-helix domain-containing protein [Desulforamulus ruminis]|uniref:Helix-turn-helix domain protein n=1 Tax=Desulforamulus ruminis (strain ATCC 23193 / DSM 2154 / NCIMB 8452 / DL) TaxID=696281 RepID=F6DTY0_DESRL|nr:helix-turn-helix transcriptional regulator [Desulforamulus ruminis]AEG58998.1 helix-turn-helix domain protein [Desulforamulus ruminis DSM 2154]
MHLIKEHRKSLGWTQTKLAQASGVSQTYISEIEAGKFQPTVKIMQKLAASMGITVSELLGEKMPLKAAGE